MSRDKNESTEKDLNKEKEVLIPPPEGSPISVVDSSGGTPSAATVERLPPVAKIEYAVRAAAKLGFSEAIILAQVKAQYTGYKDSILEKIVQNTLKPKTASENVAPSQVGNAFLGLEKRILSYQGTDYIFNGRDYEALSPDGLKYRVSAFIKQTHEISHLLTESFLRDALLSIRTETRINDKTLPNTWLTSPPEDFIGPVIPLENGNLDFGRYLINPDPAYCLFEHTDELFIINNSGITYDPTATCPKYDNFLKRTQPDPAVRNLLNEINGFILTPDTSHHVIIYNRSVGGAGTSTKALIQQLLVGKGNYSTVGAEEFHDTFSISQLQGKLVNFCMDVGEIDKAIEGNLKKISAGDEFMARRPYGQAFQIKPYSRIIIYTNEEIFFRDKSDGLWRRIIRIDWTQQIPRKEQNREILTPEYWQPELSGILNLALRGLTALKARGHFDIPDSVIQAAEQFRDDKNPAREWLRDNLKIDSKGSIRRKLLMRLLNQNLRSDNNSILTAKTVALELRRLFPQVKQGTKRTHDISGDPGVMNSDPQKERDRSWLGVRLKTDAEFEAEAAAEEARWMKEEVNG